MISFDYKIDNIKEYNPNWRQISDHSYRILVIRFSETGKTNTLLNLISHQSYIDKVNLHANDP